jgi:hypothetical protein
MRRSFPIVAWQFLPSENGASEANDAGSIADDGAALDRVADWPDACARGYVRENADCAAPWLKNLSRGKCPHPAFFSQARAFYQEVGFLMVPPTPSGTPDGNCAFGSRFRGNSLDA